MNKNIDSYRDHVSTIDQRGRRIWIYPQKPEGVYTRARGFVSIVLLAFFFAVPFIKINEQPLLLFDIIGRKFIIGGLFFWPQD
jgi:hypothetical protein